MAFRLFSSNRMEKLAERFECEIYRHPVADPLRPEIVVVQTHGTAAWLTQYLGRPEGVGIAANLETPFPADFLESLLPALLPEQLRKKFFEDAPFFPAPVTAWRIHRLLRDHAEAFPELKLSGTGLGGAQPDEARLRRFSLCVAELFEQYRIFRPELLLGWDRNHDDPADNWQRRLYLELLSEGHLGREFYFDAALRGTPARPELLPERVTLFGISSMSKNFLHLFNALSRHIDVNLFYLNPCAEYWSGVLSRRERGRLDDTGDDDDAFAGNPVLAELGAQGREFFENTLDVIGRSGLPGEEEFVHCDPEQPSLLETFQEDILTLRDRSGEAAGDRDFTDDRSLRINCCHGPRREIEVLHDQLLRAAAELSLEPRDMLVMAPDINEYAELIDAVFGSGPFAGNYTISDRKLGAVSRCAATLIEVLKLARCRCGASEILSIITSSPVRARFDFGEEETARIAAFIDDAAIRWGVDGSTRREFCGLEFDEYSWNEGLDRLLVGYAAGDEAPGFDPVPSRSAEGEEALLLGDFIALVRRLFQWRSQLRTPRPPEQWSELLREIADNLFPVSSDYARERELLDRAIGGFAAGAAAAGFTAPLPVETVIEEIERAAETVFGGLSFMRGKLTFCSLVPMRSVPSQVVALLGLSEGKFPRQDIPVDFTLLKRRLPGERSRAAEDRYLLLEAMLSARRRLLIFYSGNQDVSGRQTPPAPPLGEVIDYLTRGMGFQVTRQHLQAFDPDYFTGAHGDYFSYSRENFTAAAALTGHRDLPLPPRRPKLPEPELPTELTLDEVESFFISPCRAFLRRHSDWNGTPFRRGALDDSEPFELDYQTRETVRENAIFGGDPDALFRGLAAGRKLPCGQMGGALFREEWTKTTRLPEEVWEKFRSGTRLVLSTLVGGTLISGAITGSENAGSQFFHRFHDVTPSSLIRLRLRHLLLTVQRGAPLCEPSLALFISRGGRISLRTLEPVEVENARSELLELLELYHRGQSSPLPFFPESSFQAVTAAGDPVAAAIKAFTQPPFGTERLPEAQLPEVKSFFSVEDFGDELFAGEFLDTARCIYRPFIREVQP